ncbi:MAG TPA: DnaA regulatory inactivator Hda [Gammaproteobacteria bacterium]|nr:DnaA regulatory inactivator Hda [Gammaproteobacteria bacterium]
MISPVQLPLPVALPDGASFANFVAGRNLEAVQTLQGLVHSNERFVYLWGADGTGKTHLLHASCQHAPEQHTTAAYLPLAEADTMSPAVLESLEHLDVVCIDDVQAIAGRPEWETGLLHLYNRIRDSGAHLRVTGNAAPAELGLALRDLGSRLSGGLIFQLHPLDDENKLRALQLRARSRGMDLPEEVGRYLLHHWPRAMPKLFELLQHLDIGSLAQQRKLTIPFVRELIKQVMS